MYMKYINNIFINKTAMKMFLKPLLFLVILSIVAANIDHGFIKYSDLAGKAYEVTYNKRSLLINGKPSLFLSGSVHPPRFTVDMWDGILKKMKEDGLNMVELYLFWSLNEPEQGQFIWEGGVTDYTLFIDLAAKNDLFVNLRIGPYVCAEWAYGGLPAWLNTVDGIVLRDYNQPFMRLMENYVRKVVEKVRHQFADRGGPIVLSQIENELSAKSRQYIDWCGELADSLKLNIPFLMCNGDSANNTINSCNKNDCTEFLEKHGQSGKIQIEQPAIWTENEGWFTEWGDQTECYDGKYCEYPTRRPTELSNSIVRWFSRGGDVMNYYMYEGGNNFGITTGDKVTTMYADNVNYHSDGHPNEPKHTHCNNLHKVIIENAEAIVYDESQMGKEKKIKWWNGSEFVYGNDQIIFEYRGNGKFVGIIENKAKIDVLVKYNESEYYLSKSSSLIINSKYEVLYNTSAVPNVNSKRTFSLLQSGFEWKYYAENVNEEGKVIRDKVLHEQVAETLDKSEYMYYEATVEMDKTECELVLGSYQQNSFIIHINDEYYTDYYEMRHNSFGKKDYKFTIKVKQTGNIKLTILSEHFGIINYYKPNKPMGLHGLHDVSLCGKKLDNIEWLQRPYLTGEIKKVYTEEGSKNVEWKSDIENAPRLSWFQTKFDLINQISDDKQYSLNVTGLGRGHAFINGHDLGRYWNIIGKNQNFPTQYLYYIPKAWIKEKDNLLTVGEVIGANDLKLVSLSVSEMRSDNKLSSLSYHSNYVGDSRLSLIMLLCMIGVVVLFVGIIVFYKHIEKKNVRKMDEILDVSESDSGNSYEKIKIIL